MGTSNTFNIHFWLNLSKRTDDLAPIYARITVNKNVQKSVCKGILRLPIGIPKSNGLI